MKYFYSKEKESKLVGSTHYSDNDIKQYFDGNVFVGYKDLNDENTYISDVKFQHPTWDGEEMREMTREEVCATGDLSELGIGEVYEDGEIKKIPRPVRKYLRYYWKGNEWVLSTTRQELMLIRKDLILEYKNKKAEIAALEEFADEFEADETMDLLRTQLAEIKANINELLLLIKELGA